MAAQLSGTKCENENALLHFRMHCGERLRFNCQKCSLFSHHPFFIKARADFFYTICFQASCQLWKVIILALKQSVAFSFPHLWILIKTASCLDFNTPLKFHILENYNNTFPCVEYYWLFT